MKTKRLSAEVIEQALLEASDEQFAAERGRRNAAARKTHGGGRPKLLEPCEYCKVKYGVRDLAAHTPHCPKRPK